MKILEYRKWGDTPYAEFVKLGDAKKRELMLEGCQNGEDGIIEEIFRRLEITSGWVCEFGAIDGKQISNTIQLVKKGFNAVMIEPLKPQYNLLVETAKEFDNRIVPIWGAVEHRKYFPNKLDDILKKTEIPNEFELCSIDTDGFDYYIWEGFLNYKPKVVIIEYNPYIVREYIFLSNHINKQLFGDGSSFMSILELGQRKGYTFLGVTSGNTFWVRNELADKVGDLVVPETEITQFIKEIKKKREHFLILKGNEKYI